jgi:hypothetical protein
MPNGAVQTGSRKGTDGAETEPWRIVYFKLYESQTPVIEWAIETAALMCPTPTGQRSERLDRDPRAPLSDRARLRYQRLMALTALTVALILASLLWRSHGGLALACTMWILAFLYMRSLPSRLKTHTVAWFSVFLGLLCNAAVTIANGGIMPVAGLPTSFRPWLPSWCPEIPVHHLRVLADQRSLDYFSVGDVLIISGILLWGVGWLASSYPQCPNPYPVVIVPARPAATPK